MKKSLQMLLFVVLFSLISGPFQSVLAADLTRVNVSDFVSFCGLTFGDPCGDAEKILGRPSEVKVSAGSPKLSYFGGALEVKCEGSSYMIQKGQITDISARGYQKAALISGLESKGIRDDKLGLIGMKKNQVISIMGEPKRYSTKIADSIVYEYTSGKREVTVIIMFDDDGDHGCDNITVGWFVYE